MSLHKTYLGDAVYVQIDHGDILLTTEDGSHATNRIVLEAPDVLGALLLYLQRHGYLTADAVVGR